MYLSANDLRVVQQLYNLEIRGIRTPTKQVQLLDDTYKRLEKKGLLIIKKPLFFQSYVELTFIGRKFAVLFHHLLELYLVENRDAPSVSLDSQAVLELMGDRAASQLSLNK